MADLGRREFLAAAATATAAAALAPSALGIQPPAPPPPRRLKRAVKWGMVSTPGSVREKFALLRTLGYDGVELDSPGGPPESEVAEAVKATGLPVHGVVDSVHWQKPLSDPSPAVRDEGRRALETALHACKAYGGTTVLLVPAVVSKAVPYADAYRRSQDEIRKVLPLAADLGLEIAIENVWNNFLLSPLEAARYIDEFQSPAIGWYLDIGNIVNYGWPEDWARTLGKRVLKLDIKEFSRKKRDAEGLWKGFQAEIGDGDCDWPAVMKALAEIGYDGWATAEVGGGDEARLRDILARMDRVLVFP
ncbi:MAG: sugar phosphate isomerase/epimerase family protein [Phycisphaerales bacterium]